MAIATYDWPYGIDRSRDINRAFEEQWNAKNPDAPRYSMINKYMLIDGQVEESREIIVHTFSMGDVEDPDMYAAQPLWEWQESDFGKWVMTHAAEPPTWHRHADPSTYGYKYTITAIFVGPALTEMLLRKGS